MAMINRGLVGEIKALRAKASGLTHAGEVALTLRLIARLAHQVKPADLRLFDLRVQRALEELSESAGFARLTQVAWDWRLDERVTR